MGHKGALKDICPTNDGRHFVTASYDKIVQLWDTEYGKIVHSFTNRKTPYVVKFHPDDDKQNVLMVGTANKKILQFDTNSGDVALQYDEHMGGVNTISFMDNNKRFVSSADDKKMYLWEFGIPVVIKHISEPDMHTIPAATMHPNQKYFAG